MEQVGCILFRGLTCRLEPAYHSSTNSCETTVLVVPVCSTCTLAVHQIVGFWCPAMINISNDAPESTATSPVLGPRNCIDGDESTTGSSRGASATLSADLNWSGSQTDRWDRTNDVCVCVCACVFTHKEYWLLVTINHALSYCLHVRKAWLHILSHSWTCYLLLDHVHRFTLPTIWSTVFGNLMDSENLNMRSELALCFSVLLLISVY